ncbi:hypothetical protein OG279_09525 [Streptomyces sp. NBC_01201]|uniref:hypothetical protein n=1 Tax=unclassified Streptomyces TaxID=2593676 RepID=UPI002E15E504|nr:MULTISPECIES: hypothetical protein [unclassified Streptomyces]WSR09427.1 hypothetical protein OG265_26960 [Streptomyces sp. NBC_01208]WSR47845.1 hypothetical protein OG279_09525 [Streptomyces sp. NBC_01201]
MTEPMPEAAYRNLVEQRSIALDYLEDPDADIPDGTRRFLLALLDDGRLNGPLCGKTTATSGTEYPPCARPAGHPEAYCRSAGREAYFTATEEPTR